MVGRRSKLSKEDVAAAIAAVRAQQKLVLALPDGSLVGAALVKAQLGSGEYATVQRLVSDVLAEEASAPSEQVGEIVQDVMGERLKPITEGLTRLLQQVQAEAMRAAEGRVRMLEAGAEARIRAAEAMRDQALQQLAVAELAAPRLDELEAAAEKAGRERDRARARVVELEAELAAQAEAVAASKQEPLPLVAKPTERQVAFARGLAADLGIQLPPDCEIDVQACKAFLDQHSKRSGAVA